MYEENRPLNVLKIAKIFAAEALVGSGEAVLSKRYSARLQYRQLRRLIMMPRPAMYTFEAALTI